MGPELEPRGIPEVARDISACKENGSIPQGPEDKLMQCTSNYQDNPFDMEALLDEEARVLDRGEDVEVNITGCTYNSGNVKVEFTFQDVTDRGVDPEVNVTGFTDTSDNVKVESTCQDVTDTGVDAEVNITGCTDTSDNVKVESTCQDVTESSSSFGNSVSGTENGSISGDVEVESQFCGGNTLASVFDGFSGPFQMRKKKLTDHWRRFIRPPMWRCKWIELKIKEFQCQAHKYDRELAEYDQRKQLEFEKFTFEGFDAKSIPFSSQVQRKKLMTRKRRKRVEETIDVASYLSRHNLFSYYENKRSNGDGASIDENGVIPAGKIINSNDKFRFNDGLLSLEFRDGDNTPELILWKIEGVQLRVRKLKTQIDKVISENPGNLSSINKLSLLVPCNELTSSDQNPASPLKNGNRMPIRTLYNSSQYEDLMAESAELSHEEVAPLLDMIESKDHPRVRGSSINTEDGNQIHNQAAKEEHCNFEEVMSQFTEKPQVPNVEQKTVPPVLVPKVELPYERPVHNLKFNGKSLPTLNSNVPNNKRKPRRKKSSGSKRSRRSFG